MERTWWDTFKHRLPLAETRDWNRLEKNWYSCRSSTCKQSHCNLKTFRNCRESFQSPNLWCQIAHPHTVVLLPWQKPVAAVVQLPAHWRVRVRHHLPVQLVHNCQSHLVIGKVDETIARRRLGELVFHHLWWGSDLGEKRRLRSALWGPGITLMERGGASPITLNAVWIKASSMYCSRPPIQSAPSLLILVISRSLKKKKLLNSEIFIKHH